MLKSIIKYYFLFIVVFLAIQLNAQECEWLEAHKSSVLSRLQAVATDNDNNVINVGDYVLGADFQGITLPPPVSSRDGFIAKYTDAGKIIWVKPIKSINVSNGSVFHQVETDANNNIYVAGVFWDTVDFGNGITAINPSPTSSFVIVKYDSSGLAQWANVISDQLHGFGHHTRLAISKSGEIFLGFTINSLINFRGTTQTLANQNISPSVGLAKYDSLGNYVDSKIIVSGISTSEFHDISLDGNNNVYLVTQSYNTGTIIDNNNYTKGGVFIVKIDSALTTINSRIISQYYGGAYAYSNKLFSISAQPNGKFAITGRFADTIDFGGVTLIAKYGDVGQRKNLGINNCIAFYDSSLNAIWAKKENTLSKYTFTQPWGGIIIKDGFIFFGGITKAGRTSFGDIELNTDSMTNGTPYFVKMDVLGNFLWAFSGGRGSVEDLSVDNNFNNFVTGSFVDSIGIINKKVIPNYSGGFLAKIKDYRIVRGYVSPGPYCAGDSFEVPYTKYGRYDTGNYFIAELSDSSGNFEGGQIELGRLKSVTNGIVKGKLPLFNVATNNKYRIRILSTKPVVQSFYKEDTLQLLIYSRDSANAGEDRTICYGQEIRLGTTGGTEWLWSPANRFVDTNEASNRQPLIQLYDSAHFRIIISDSSGCGVTDTDYVKIYVRPNLTTKIIGDSSICKGYNQNLEAKVTGGDSTNYWYKWYIKGQNFLLSSTASVTVSPPVDRTYLLLVGDSCTDKIDTAYFTIKVSTNLQAKILGDTTLCYGETSILSVLGSGCAPNKYTYEWTEKGSNKILSNNDSLIVSPNTTTHYQVILKDTSTLLEDTAQVTITVRPKLTLTINTDSTICIGETAELRATAQGGRSNTHSIQWSAVGGQWSVGTPKTTVSPAQTTTYKAILSDGCTVENDSAEITITVRPKLTLTLNKDSTICIGEEAELRAIVTGGNTPTRVLQWTANNQQLSTNNTIKVTPTALTVYKALLSDGCTTPSDSAEITITVRPKLTLTLNTDSTICIGEEAELRAITSGGLESNYTIKWSEVGSQWSVNTKSVTVSPTTTTIYKAKLSDGCTTLSDSSEITITVRAPLQLTTTAKDSICSNEILLLTATPNGGLVNNYSIQWITDNGLWTSTQNPATDTPQITTKYIAQLSDNCSPTVYDTLDIIVLQIPKANFSVNPTFGCPPLTVTLTDNSTDNDSTQNAWTIGLGEYQGTKTQTHELLKTGTYNIKLNVKNQLGCSDEKTQTRAITVFTKPKANFIIKPDIKEVEEPLQLYNISQNYTSVIWDMGDGNIITPQYGKDTSYKYHEDDTGQRTVQLIAINNQGCKDTSTKTILLFNKVNCSIPSAFTPNGDGLNNTFKPICVGVGNYTLTIYNRWGQVIYQRENGAWDGNYIENPVPMGVYMYKIQIDAQSQKKKLTYGTVQLIR